MSNGSENLIQGPFKDADSVLVDRGSVMEERSVIFVGAVLSLRESLCAITQVASILSAQ